MTEKLIYKVEKYEDGYITHRNKSPYFCFVTHTKEEAIQIGDDAIISYYKIFGDKEIKITRLETDSDVVIDSKSKVE